MKTEQSEGVFKALANIAIGWSRKRQSALADENLALAIVNGDEAHARVCVEILVEARGGKAPKALTACFDAFDRGQAEAAALFLEMALDAGLGGDLAGLELRAARAMARSQGDPSREFAARLVSALSAAGADWNRRDSRGRSAVHVAAQAGDVEFLDFLADAGCDFDVIDSKGRSALSIAAGERVLSSFEVAGKLLRRGASPDAGRNDQRSALASAIERGDESMFELLVSHGASEETLREQDWEEGGAWVETLVGRAQAAVARTDEKLALALRAREWAKTAQERRALGQACADPKPVDKARLRL